MSGPAGALHTFNTRKIGMLLDLGWTLPIIDPNAVWVTFEANGGEGQISPQQFSPGVAQNLRLNSFKKNNYTFVNWNTSPAGTGTEYADRESITISADMKLYAQWEGSKYTLTFNANGGTVNPISKQVTYEMPIGELPEPVRAGYTFHEWRIGSEPIYGEWVWLYNTNQTATARWTANLHTITATATSGGAISSPGNNTIPEGGSKTFIITPDENYTLLHVLVNDNSVGAVFQYEFKNVVASHTIHAVFGSVGINDFNCNETVLLYPNPTTEKFNVQSLKFNVQSIEVFDVYEKKLSSHHLITSSSHNKIDISHLQAGIYLVQIKTENGMVTKKIVKL
jgi:hypothetical protein